MNIESRKSLSFMLLNKATLHIAASSEFILIFFLILNLSTDLCIDFNLSISTYRLRKL